MCFLYTDTLLLGIYDKDCVGDSAHLLDTAKVLLQFLHLLAKSNDFLLGKHFKSTVLFHRLDLFESVDSALDGLEVGQHSAQPSLIYIEHTAALRLNLDGVLSLFLGSYKQDDSALCGDVEYRVIGLVNLAYGFLQVDDVDTVSLGIDVGSHFRVPSSRLMSEVNTGFQQLLH